MKRYELDRGRAAPIGVVTRKSDLVRKRCPDTKPLPLHLQVLPQRRKRLPRHIGCSRTAHGITDAAVRLMREEPQHYFLMMKGLEETPQAWRVVALGQTRYTNSFAWGYAWVTAATGKGVVAYLERNDAEKVS